MENTSSNKSKLPVIIIGILLVAINILAWAIFWLLSANTTQDIPQPQANERVIPLGVEANHPAVTEASINYVYTGQIFRIPPITNQEGVIELQLTAQGQIVPQTFYIDEKAQQVMFQRSSDNNEEKIALKDLLEGDTVEIRTTHNLKDKSDAIVSIVRIK